MISSNRNLSCGMPYIRPSLKKKPLPLFIKCFLLTGFSAAIFSSPYSFAQEESDDDVQESSGSSALEEVVITGIRASQRGAIDLKKEAGTMVDAIIAEDVSKFPDKNVTEAVQRIPGVQITRDFGEGAGINIRGMEQGLNRIEFDGVSALGDGSRNVALTDTASELVKVLTVIKGSEARITEGGIGGTVQIEMRKANDFDDHFFSASFENQYNDLSQEHSPDANITGVYKFSDDFGVMANLNFSDKQTMIHALRNTEWSRWADYDNSPEKSVVDADYADFNSASECTDAYGPNGEDNSEALRDCQKQWWDFGPRLPRYGNWGREESRISSNIGFGWDVNDKLSVFADYTYNERDKLATDYNLSIGTGSVSGVDPDSVVVDENHNIRAFTSADAEVVNRTLKFDWLQKKSLFKIGADYIGDKIEINGIVSASETEQDIDSRDAQITSSGVAGVEFLLDEQGAPQFDLTSGYRYQDPLNDPDPGEFELFDVNNPASYNARARYKYAPVEQQQTEDSAKVDFAYNFDEGKFITKARTGLRWAKATLESQNFENNIIRDVGNFYARLDENGNVVLDDDGEVIRDEWTLDRHLELISGSTTETPRFFPSFDLGVGTLESYQAVHTDTLISRLEQEARAGVSRASLQPRRGKYYIEEESYAGYVQIDFSQPIAGLDFWGNVGVRVVKTETVSEGDVIIDAVYDVGTEEFNGNQPIIWDWNGSALDLNAQPNYTEDDIVDKNQTVEFQTFSGRDTSEGSYTDVLPSINLNLALIPDELTLYAGAAKVMSRPAIDVLNINADCTRYANLKAREENTDNKCDAGNPNIKPYRATQWDLAINWYPNEDSMVSAAIFSKKLTSYLGPDQITEDVEFFAGGENAGVVYNVTQPDNVTGVTTQGFEIQGRTMFTMLPGIFSNFGVDANYTYMDAKDVPYTSELDGSALPLLSQSKNSFNLAGFYEDDYLTVRLAYNYRDEYLAATKSTRGDNPVYFDAAGHLDAKVSYNIGETGFTVFADARNLLGEVELQTSGEGRLADLRWSGREYAIGITYKM